MSLPRLLLVCVCVLYHLQTVQSASLLLRSDNLPDSGLGVGAHALVEGSNTGRPLLTGMITEEVEEITTQSVTSTKSTSPTTMTEALGSPKWLKMLRLVILCILTIIWIAMGIYLFFQSSPPQTNSTKPILAQASAEVSTSGSGTANHSTSSELHQAHSGATTIRSHYFEQLV